MSAFVDLTQFPPFGRLTVIARGPLLKNNQLWKCLCACGTELFVYGQHLKSGKSESCGCLNKEKLSKRATHRMIHTPEYRSWHQMKNRCLNPKDKSYHNYDGRGIDICSRWIDSFQAFYEDMGPRPGLEYSLERINNSFGYSKENCRWATKAEQARNRRTNHLITFADRTACMEDWAHETNVDRNTLVGRLSRGWSIEQAMTIAARTLKSHQRITFDGHTASLTEWAEEKDIPYHTLFQRLRKGWSIERALTTPVQPRRKQHA